MSDLLKEIADDEEKEINEKNKRLLLEMEEREKKLHEEQMNKKLVHMECQTDYIFEPPKLILTLTERIRRLKYVICLTFHMNNFFVHLIFM